MEFEILTYPDERLKQVAQPVVVFDAALVEWVQAFEAFMRSQPGGVGIAAPQVGRFERILVVDVSGRKKTQSNGRMILINLEILEWDGFALGREGCMSVPDYTGNVVRAEQIRYRAQDEYGEWHEYESAGFEARAVQHEADHLDGLLFLDRLVSRKTDLFPRKNYS